MGGVTEFAVGDRVTSHFDAEWHEGPWLAEYTDQQIGAPLNGGLAEYQVLAAANVVPTPAYADAAGEAQKRLGIGQSVNGRP